MAPNTKKRTKRQIQEAQAAKRARRGAAFSDEEDEREASPPIFAFLEGHQPSSSSNSFGSGAGKNDVPVVIEAYEAELIDDPELGGMIEGRRLTPVARTRGKRTNMAGEGRDGEEEEKEEEKMVGDREDGYLLRVVWERKAGERGGQEEESWADRFSYLHILSPSSLFASPLPLPPTPHTQSDPILISTLLPFSANSGDSAGEGGGWSDLPSDHEDTWFFSEDEAEEFEREQKRRRLDAMRLARLQQRKEEEGTASDGEDNDADKGKGKEWAEDEVPTSQILALMRHTSSAITSAPNPFLLESRILTNHSTDPRFAFLRGRWKHVWEALKSGKEVGENGRVIVKSAIGGGTGGGVVGLLGGYGSDSDSESGSDQGDGDGKGDGKQAKGAQETVSGEQDREVATAAVEADEPKVPPNVEALVKTELVAEGQVIQEEEAEAEAKKEARRQKLKAWALKRKGTAGGDASSSSNT